MPLRALASKRSPSLLDCLPKTCWPRFRPRETTYVRRRDWPANLWAGLLQRAPPDPTTFLFLGREYMTLSREQIRELAELRDNQSSALSFYFQPATPRNKAHKE